MRIRINYQWQRGIPQKPKPFGRTGSRPPSLSASRRGPGAAPLLFPLRGGGGGAGPLLGRGALSRPGAGSFGGINQALRSAWSTQECHASNSCKCWKILVSPASPYQTRCLLFLFSFVFNGTEWKGICKATVLQSAHSGFSFIKVWECAAVDVRPLTYTL